MQEEKRRDPVYLSMAAHITTIAPEHDHSEVALAEQVVKQIEADVQTNQISEILKKCTLS